MVVNHLINVATNDCHANWLALLQRTVRLHPVSWKSGSLQVKSGFQSEWEFPLTTRCNEFCAGLVCDFVILMVASEK